MYLAKGENDGLASCLVAMRINMFPSYSQTHTKGDMEPIGSKPVSLPNYLKGVAASQENTAYCTSNSRDDDDREEEISQELLFCLFFFPFSSYHHSISQLAKGVQLTVTLRIREDEAISQTPSFPRCSLTFIFTVSKPIVPPN